MSGFFWNGAPRRVLNAGYEGKATLATSSPLIAELRVVLSRSKFEQKYTTLDNGRESRNGLYQANYLSPPAPSPRIVSDPDDNVVIGTALAAQADLIVTGDRALLAVAEYQSIRIVSAIEALRLLVAG